MIGKGKNIAVVLARKLSIFLVILLCVGCHKSDNTLKITFSRACKDNLAGVSFYDFQVEKEDSIFYRSRMPMVYAIDDTLKLDSLPGGTYEIKYKDVLGRAKIRRVKLENGKQQLINIVLDSIDTSRLLSKTPIANLKEGESYTVDWIGGDIASMHGYYKVKKENGKVAIKIFDFDAIVPTEAEISMIKQFEAELLAINGAHNMSDLGNFTYRIITSKDTIQRTDQTGIWAGYHYPIEKILRSRFEEK